MLTAHQKSNVDNDNSNSTTADCTETFTASHHNIQGSTHTCWFHPVNTQGVDNHMSVNDHIWALCVCALRRLALHHIPGHSPVQYMAFQYISRRKAQSFILFSSTSQLLACPQVTRWAPSSARRRPSRSSRNGCKPRKSSLQTPTSP